VRLIQLADYGGPYAGSFVPMLRAAFAAGRSEGWEPLAVLSEVARDRPWLELLEHDGVPVRFVSARPRAQAAAAVAEVLDAAAGPAILHSHFSSFDVPIARAARRRSGATLFWHVHSHLDRDLRTRARNTARFAVYGRRVDEILCVAPDVARAVRERLAPRGRVHYFPNAIDTDRYPLAGPEERARARQWLGVPAGSRLVLHLGWDWHRKGGDLFLAAVERLEGRPGLAFATVGGSAAADEIRARGLEPRVRLLDPVDDAARLFAAADVLVSPSRQEGMPFSMTEAICRGTPVVASSIPGQVAIGRGLAACRLTALEPAAIAAAVEALLSRADEVAERDARAARDRIVETMDLGVWAQRLLARYRRAAQA
jgi:glycosyltransferase involved in cell wall biosynthesis